MKQKPNVLERKAPAIHNRLVGVLGDSKKIVTIRNGNPAEYLVFLDGKIVYCDGNSGIMVQDAMLLHVVSNNERHTQLGGSYFDKTTCEVNFLQTVERPKGYKPEKQIYNEEHIGKSERKPLSAVAPTLDKMFREDVKKKILGKDIGSLSVELMSKSRTSNPAEHLHYAVTRDGKCIGTLECMRSTHDNSSSNELQCSIRDCFGPLKMHYSEELTYHSNGKKT